MSETTQDAIHSAAQPLYELVTSDKEKDDRRRAFGIFLVDRMSEAYDVAQREEARLAKQHRKQVTCGPLAEIYAAATSTAIVDCIKGVDGFTGEPLAPELNWQSVGVSEKYIKQDEAIVLSTLSALALKWAEQAYGEEFTANVRVFFPQAGIPPLAPQPVV